MGGSGGGTGIEEAVARSGLRYQLDRSEGGSGGGCGMGGTVFAV